MKKIKQKLICLLTLIMVFQGALLSNTAIIRANQTAETIKYGFKLVKQTYISSLKTTAMQYEHIKSGAHLLFLKNDDPNKYFSISFRTPALDNSGITHIIEHCLLDGSSKYPVNSVFNQFQNQSLCSVINAITTSDQTSYYGQTSNDKDLENLMSILLDGVFHPKVLTTPEIFWQEAGHYELSADINNTLKYINDNYLSNFNKVKSDSSIKMQAPFSKNIEKTYYYDAEDNSNDNSVYFSRSYNPGKATDKDIQIPMEIIFDMISKRLQSAHPSNQLNFFDYGMWNTAQPIYRLTYSGKTESQKDTFKALIDNVLNDISKNGFTKEEIQSQIQAYDKIAADQLTDINIGETLRSQVMKSWLYDGDPTLYLDSNSYIEALQKELKERYFEKFLRKYMLNNQNQAVVTLKPQNKPTTEDKSVIAVKDLTSNQLKKINEDTIKLRKWQQLASSDEAISKLPLLDAKDIKTTIPKLSYDNIDGQKVMFTPMETKGTSYCNFYFDTSRISQDKIPYIELLNNILGDALIQQNSGVKFNEQGQVSAYGKISFDALPYSKYDDASKYNPKLRVSMTVPQKNMDISLQSLKKLIIDYKFEDKESIKRIISQLKLSTKNYISYYRPLAYFSESGRYYECLKGLPQYKFLSYLNDNFDKKWSDIHNNLIEVYNDIFNKENLIIGFIGTQDGYSSSKNSLKAFLKDIKTAATEQKVYDFSNFVKNEAFTKKSNVINIFETGYNFKKLGYKYSGKMKVLEAILNEKLFQETRANGGYGAIVSVNANGILSISMSRMTDIQKSIDALSRSITYLKTFKADSNQMKRYIISAINKTLSKETQVYVATDYQDMVVYGKQDEAYSNELNELLSTTPEDIQKMAGMIEDVIKQNVYFVVGNEAKINEKKDMFTNILNILQTD